MPPVVCPTCGELGTIRPAPFEPVRSKDMTGVMRGICSRCGSFVTVENPEVEPDAGPGE